MTPELELLLAACATFVDDDRGLGLAACVARPFNDRTFLKLARKHRFVLIAYKVAVRRYPKAFSSEVIKSFERDVQRLTLTHVEMDRALLAIHSRFGAQGIRHFFLKGPLLGDQLFPGKLLRYSVDIDVMIDRSNSVRADQVLRKLGFETQAPTVGLRGALHQFARKDRVYLHRGGRCKIELHWRSYAVEVIFNRRFDWNRHLVRQSFHGQRLPVPEPEYNALYLCFHAAHHSWSRLRWLLDIVLYARKTDLDWDQVRALAAEHHMENTVAEALYLARQYFGVDFGGVPTVAPPGLEARLALVDKEKLTAAEIRARRFHKRALFSKSRYHVSSTVVFYSRKLFRLGGLLNE